MTTYTRLTDSDRRAGPLTYGRSSWRPWRIVFSTGGGDEEHSSNHLTAYAFGWVARLDLPTRFKPWRQWVPTGHYEWAKSPEDGYWDVHSREYGFCLNEGHFTLYLGAQTHDSTTTQDWGCFLPWTQRRHIRTSFYDGDGKHFWTEWSRPRGFKLRDQWASYQAVKDACPTAVFEFDDFDGKRIKATCRVEEREYRHGTGWFKWLSLFRKPLLSRSLDIEFSEEVGPEKGSWKGGTLGHGINMLPGEAPEAAFRRYCEQDQHSKYRPFRLTYVGRVEA